MPVPAENTPGSREKPVELDELTDINAETQGQLITDLLAENSLIFLRFFGTDLYTVGLAPGDTIVVNPTETVKVDKEFESLIQAEIEKLLFDLSVAE